MLFTHVGRRVLTVLAALSGPAARSAGTPPPDVAEPVGPTTPGVRLAWSKTVATGTGPFAVVGETVLLADGAALLGLRPRRGAPPPGPAPPRRRRAVAAAFRRRRPLHRGRRPRRRRAGPHGVVRRE